MMYACEGIGKTVHVNIDVNNSKSLVLWLTRGKLLYVGADYINTFTWEVAYQRKATFSEKQYAVAEIRKALVNTDNIEPSLQDSLEVVMKCPLTLTSLRMRLPTCTITG